MGQIALIGGLVLVIIAIAAIFFLPVQQAFPSSNPQIQLSMAFNQTPRLNATTTLNVKVIASSDSPNTTVSVMLPDGIEFVGGVRNWRGNLKANESAEFTAKIKIKSSDELTVKAVVGTPAIPSGNEISFPVPQIPITSGIATPTGGNYSNETWECSNNRECEDNQYCENHLCLDINCTDYCTHIIDHQCRPFECCTNEECVEGYSCIDNECRFPVSNSTNKIAFVSNGSTFIMDNNGSNVVKLTATDFSNLDYAPAWSPDGRKLAIGFFTIYLINSDGTNKTFLTNGYGPSWDPAGEKIYFGAEGYAYGINVINVASGQLATIFSTPNVVKTAVSPDGQRVAYARDPMNFNPPVLFVVNSDGNNNTQFRPEGTDPSWSPNGNRIAYANNGIHIINLETGQDTFIAPGFAPSWSPLGDKLAFAREGGGISTISIDGTNQVNLTDFGTLPAWSPIQT